MKSYLRIIIFSFLILLAFNQKDFGQCTTAKYATLPYTQYFESWITLCDSIDSLNVPDSSWINIPVSGDASWRRNDQWYAGSWSISGDVPTSYYTPPPLGGVGARYHADGNNTDTAGTLELYINCSTTIGTKQLSFYYFNPNSPSDLNVYISTDGGATFGPSLVTCVATGVWTNYIVPIVSNSAQTIISFVATPGYGYGYSVWLGDVEVLPACQGKPVAGIVSSVPASCSQAYSDTLQLSLIGSSQAGGLSYIWQQSANNNTWSIIAGDTTPSIAVAIVASTYYRAIVICNGSGLSDTTNGIHTIPVNFFRKIPYTQDFESWMNRCDTLDVPDTGWINNPPSGNDSWRRDDEGSTAGWGDTSVGIYYPASVTGSYSARFHSAWSYAGSTGALNLYLDCTGLRTPRLSFYYLNKSGDDYMNVLLSIDNGATFTTIGTYTTTPDGWTQDSLTFISESPQTIISFLATSDDGTSDIGLDDVQVKDPLECSSKPVAGNIVILPFTCSVPVLANPFDTLFLSGGSIAPGLLYAWQQSSDSINWSTIVGADTSRISVSLANLTYYRSIVTCKGSGLSDTTAGVKVSSFQSFFRKVPYTQNFASWISRCDSLDVPDTGWLNIPSTGDDSWRRDDQGGSAGWDYYNAYGPSACPGSSYSAAFNATSGTMGALDLFVNCSTIKGTKQLSFYYINQSYDDSMNVYVSTDGGATFGPSLITCYPNGNWQQYKVPIALDSPQVIISFVATADGHVNMGIDSVQVLPACQGKPFAGNVVTKLTNSKNEMCFGSDNDTIMLLGGSLGGGISYIWQQSNDSISWNTIAGDSSTGVIILPSNTITTYCRAIVTCGNSGLSDTTEKVKISPVNGVIPLSFYRKIPYTQSFESWMNQCDSLDVPDTGWFNSPPNGDFSWRRDDQGSTAGWNCPSCGVYSPPSVSGQHSARFHVGPIFGESGSGTLSLYVNCSTVKGAKKLSFFYMQQTGAPFGPSTLSVYLSEDGGQTFGPSLFTYTFSQYWQQFIVPIASDSPKTVIQFSVNNNDNGYLGMDIGLDSVQVLPGCQDKPVAGNASASIGAVCSNSDTSIVSITGEYIGITLQWQSSSDSVHWSNLAGDTTASFTTLPISSSTYYRCIVTCTQSGLSDTSNKVYILFLPNCLTPYCAPQSTYETGDNIGNVTISYGTDTILSNGIDTPAINSSLTYTGQYYINYLDKVINLVQGYTYNISTDAISNVGGGNYPDTAYVYIDYNRDGIWEPNERAFSAPYIMPFSNTPQPVPGTFTVPLNADTGITEMRVQLSYSSPVDTDCYNGNNQGGETEDYLVHIASLPPCSGVPSAGNIEPASDTLCTGASVNFYLLGTTVAAGLTYEWQSSPDNSTWTAIPGAVNNQYNVSDITFSSYYRCQVTCSNSGQAAYSTSSYIYISSPPVNPIAKNDTICGPGAAVLSANGGSGNYYWFTSTADSLPLYSGSTYSPYVTSDKTFYVNSATSGSAYCTVGFDSLATGSFNYPGCSAFNSNGQLNSVDTGIAGLVFNVQSSITLTGVFIFPQYSGSFYIYLLDSSGIKLDSALATVTNPQFPNPYWVPLDFSVAAGTGYQLVARTSQANCMANSDSRYSFPFTDCNNSVTITGGTADGLPNNSYYFFYKWVINQGCESSKIPVSVYIKAPPALSVTATPNNGYSCNGQAFSGTLTASGSSYTSFTWSPAIGLNSQAGSTVTVTATATTTYTVTAANGICNNTTTTIVNIEPPILINQPSASSNYNCQGVPIQLASDFTVLQPIVNYCLPPLPGDCNEYMSAFNFDNISITNNSCPGYVNYADTALVQAGKSYAISITPSQNTNSYSFGVWLDYNQNGVFTDSSELAFVVADQAFSGSQTITGTITIPKNALYGYTRMRVINFLNNTPDLYSSNCNLESIGGGNQTNIGSIEDFTVDVTNNSGISYKWTPTNGLSNPSILNPVATPTASTTYSLIITDSVSGCTDTGSVTIYVYSNPDVKIYAPHDTLCLGNSEVLDAGIGFTSYLWSTGDTTEDITINSAGSYSVKVTAQDGCAGNDTVNIVTETCAGISQADAGNYSIGVYPNPFDNQFTLELNGLPAGEFVFDMTNTLGQKVLEFKDQNATAVYKRSIDLHELPSGMYYISIVLNGKNFVKQIIKTN